jgi:uncharacterized phiE125 gp8 family phage protein
MAQPVSMKLTTKPSREPVTLDELKSAADVDYTDHDTELDSLITTARQHVENVTRQRIVRQKWRVFFRGFADEMLLAPGYVREVSAIQYLDADGATQTASTALYDVDVSGQRVLRAYQQVWPTPRYQENAVWIDVWSGMYDETASPVDVISDVDAPIKRAIMMLASYWYDRDFRAGEAGDPTKAVAAMLQPYWMPNG